jgi:hypothetical protein
MNRSWRTVWLLAPLAGCYTYRPLPPLLEPAPQTQVALVLSDQGRVGAGPIMGSGIARVEGSVIGATDSEYLLRIAGVTDIRGRESHWSGERVSLRRSWVDNAYERRFSKPRTYALVGALAAGFATIVVTRHLFGIGGPSPETAGGGGGSQQ